MERQRRRHFRGPYQGWLLVLGRSGSHPSKWLALLEGSWPLDSWGTLCFSLERIHRGVIKAQVLLLAVLYVSVNTKHTPSQWRGCGLVVLVCSVWVMWSRSHPKIGQYELCWADLAPRERLADWLTTRPPPHWIFLSSPKHSCLRQLRVAAPFLFPHTFFILIFVPRWMLRVLYYVRND